MSDISQEYSEDEDIAPYEDKTHDSDGFAAQFQEEYDGHAGKGPIDIDGDNSDGKSVSSSSNTGESDEESWFVSGAGDLDPDLQAIKDRIYRSHNTSGETNTLKIRIPATVNKRKHSTDKSPSLLSEEEDAPSKRKKSKSSIQMPTKQSRKRVEDDDSDTVSNIVAKHHRVKKQRGRPKTANGARANKDFLVPVYLEIAQEPVLMRGKTHKGDKFVKQPPITDGPFHLTRKMTWEIFRKEVADIAGIGKENFGTISEGLKWSFQKKCPLPLKDEMGFKTLMSQVKGMKDPNSAIIIVSLPPLAKSRSKHTAYESEINAFSDAQDDDGSIYGRKINLDDQLASIVSTLEESHPIGSCPTHLSIRCYVQKPQGWHFDINSTKLKVWANAILRKETSYDRIPLGSNFFNPKDRIGGTTLQAQAPQTPIAANQLQHVLPASFSPLASPWGFPSPLPQIPPAMYQLMQQWGMPSHIHPFMPPAPVSPSPTTIHRIEPSASTGSTSMNDAAAAWCCQHNLGDEESQCLRKLGFRVGDDLDELTDEMWKFAEALPLCRMRILRAYKSSKDVGSSTQIG